MLKHNFTYLKSMPLIIGAILFLTFFISSDVQSQAPTCGGNVPFFQLDLSGAPDSVWRSPAHVREGNCCGTIAPDRCTSYKITIDTGTVMLIFRLISGAVPKGSMFYQINCGPQIPVGQPICVTGVGPHYLTFCKPGNNPNEYEIVAVPKPIVPKNIKVRQGCSANIKVLGFVDSTITWKSVFPGSTNDYNYLLSCNTKCAISTFTPVSSIPGVIKYEVCGFPRADECGFVATCDTVTVTIYDSLKINYAPNPAEFCDYGPGSGVLLSALPTGGDGKYIYEWRDTAGNILGSSSTYFADQQQTYTLIVNDSIPFGSNNCGAVNINIPVTKFIPPVVDAGNNQLVCGNVSFVTLNGQVNNASGGFWSGGLGAYSPSNTSLTVAYTPTVAEMSSGSITLFLTSTGALGSCTNETDSVIIDFAAQLNIDLTDTLLDCGISTVLLNPVITGGIKPYSFYWSNGLSDTAITVGPGNYCLNIVDSMNCIVSKCVNVTAPTQLNLSMSSNSATCNGCTDGDATATPSGGTPPYSYSWVPAGSTPTISGLGYGIYSVTVTDNKGCTIQGSVVVNEPRCLGLSATISNTNILCFEDNDAFAVIAPSGGTSPYSYMWDDALMQTTDTAKNLSAGVYTVIVTDATLCDIVKTVSISQPTILTNIMNSSNTTNIAANNGTATANPSGGILPYKYFWNTGDTLNSISGLVPGTYFVTITDSNGCTKLDSAVISQGSCEDLVVFVNPKNVSCFSGNDGEAALVILFGMPPFNITWSTGFTGDTLKNLIAGSYSVTVEDATGCEKLTTFSIIEPSQLSLGMAKTDINCFGNNNGTIDANVSGGFFPYSYSWSNGEGVQDLINLSSGTYTLTTTDFNGCTVMDSAIISEPLDINIASLETMVSCFGLSDGAIDITVTGGQTTYTYSWDDGPSGEDRTGLLVGGYNLTVTDANGCVKDKTILISQPDTIDISYDTTLNRVSCNGLNDASIDISVAGGTTPYSYLWNTGDVSEDIIGVTAGNYSVTVTDVNGCSDILNVTVTEPDTIGIDASASIFTNVSCNGLSDGAIDLTVTGGNGGNSFVWSHGPTTEDVSGLTAGNYSVTITDALSCTNTFNFVINEPDMISLAGNNSSNITCFGFANGIIDISIQGGTAPYTYLWSTGATTEDISNLDIGTYTVEINDKNNCMNASFTFNITQPDALDANIYSPLYPNTHNVTFNNSYDGSIDLEVFGGTQPYNFEWNNGSNSEDLSFISAGTYFVLITDNNGCNLTKTITLTQPYILAMPDGYSPNNDDRNDFFVVKGIEAYPNNEFEVFNRWGSLVYKKGKYLNQWNGQSIDGSQLPDATYFVVLNINDGEIILKGFVDLRRK